MDIKEIFYDVFDSLELNDFGTLGKPDSPMYERPLIGATYGDDPYFAFLKEHIGPFYWSPEEVFEMKYGTSPDPHDLRVVSMVFPQTAETKIMQGSAKVFPCDNWLVSRGEWEPMLREFGEKAEKALEEQGIRAISLDLRPEFSLEKSENLGIASRWSHRHTAFACGMGTFSLNDGFISEKGIAIRLTSYIIEAPLEVNDRGKRGPYDWCLFYAKGTCGACIKRCPVNAISLENGHDKDICAAYEDVCVNELWPDHIERRDYIFGCGLCQSAVPCRDRRPV